MQRFRRHLIEQGIVTLTRVTLPHVGKPFITKDVVLTPPWGYWDHAGRFNQYWKGQQQKRHASHMECARQQIIYRLMYGGNVYAARARSSIGFARGVRFQPHWRKLP